MLLMVFRCEQKFNFHVEEIGTYELEQVMCVLSSENLVKGYKCSSHLRQATNILKEMFGRKLNFTLNYAFAESCQKCKQKFLVDEQ